METMKALVRSWLVACVSLCAALPAAAQTPVGALAVDERRGQQYGWALEGLFWQSIVNSTNPADFEGIPGAVPERGVPGAGAEQVGGAAELGGRYVCGGRPARRWGRVTSFGGAGLWSACLVVRHGGDLRCPVIAREVPPRSSQERGNWQHT